MKNQSIITLFVDDELQPIGEFPTPLTFELDTRKLTDGDHVLKVISRDHSGKEGIKLIPFIVRNGPAIAVEGLKKDEVVEGILPVMINAYGRSDQSTFTLTGSETPQSIPWWLLVGFILFIGWAAYFLITSLSVKLW